MASYPDILLLKQTYPILANEDVVDCALLRKTICDVYAFLAKPNYEPDDILNIINLTK
jgi:hypothetical protein